MNIIGIGTDLEEVSVFETHWNNQKLSFFERIFTQAEINYCKAKPHPAQHFAARFCAKEAAVKASASVCKTVISDFEIMKNNDQPFIELVTTRHGNCFDDYQWMVSMSHTENYAQAIVMIGR